MCYNYWFVFRLFQIILVRHIIFLIYVKAREFIEIKKSAPEWERFFYKVYWLYSINNPRPRERRKRSSTR